MKKHGRVSGDSFIELLRPLGIISAFCVSAIWAVGIYGAYDIGLVGALLSVLIFCAGYGVMALWARIRHIVREQDNGGYEASGRHFKLGSALLPIIVGGLISLWVRSLAARLEYLYAINTVGASYDPDSILPYFVMALFLFFWIYGTVLWFIPTERLFSQRFAMISVIATFMGFAYSLMIGGSNTLTGVCFICYILTTAVGLNQRSLTRSYRGTVMMLVSTRARLYNIRLVCIFGAAVLILALAGWVVVVGVITLVRALLFIFVNAEVSSGTTNGLDAPSSTDSGSLFSMYVFGAHEAKDSVNYYLFCMFAIMAISALIMFIFRRKGEMRRLIETIKTLIHRFIDFIFSPISANMNYFIANMQRESDENCTFDDDEERLISDPKIGNAKRYERARRTKRDFLAGLKAERTEADRLCYAYAVYVSQMREVPQLIKRSDTARELYRKVHRKRIGGDVDMSDVTYAFERAKYSGDIDSAEARAATEKLCRVVLRNIGNE